MVAPLEALHKDSQGWRGPYSIFAWHAIFSTKCAQERSLHWKFNGRARLPTMQHAEVWSNIYDSFRRNSSWEYRRDEETYQHQRGRLLAQRCVSQNWWRHRSFPHSQWNLTFTASHLRSWIAWCQPTVQLVPLITSIFTSSGSARVISSLASFSLNTAASSSLNICSYFSSLYTVVAFPLTKLDPNHAVEPDSDWVSRVNVSIGQAPVPVAPIWCWVSASLGQHCWLFPWIDFSQTRTTLPTEQWIDKIHPSTYSTLLIKGCKPETHLVTFFSLNLPLLGRYKKLPESLVAEWLA